MEILLEEAAKEIFDFSRLEQAPQKQQFEASINEFRVNAEGLRRLASTGGGEDDKELRLLLDNNLTKQFSYFKDLGERLISLQENQSEKILQRRALLIQKLDPIIDIRLQNILSPSDLQYAQKHQALLEMEINLHELFSASSGYIVKSDPSLKDRINDSIVDFQYWLERFLELNGYYDDGSSNNSSKSTNTTGSLSVTANPAANTHRLLSMAKIMTVIEEEEDDTTSIADSDNTSPATTIILPTGEEQQLKPITAIADATVPAALPPVQQIQNAGQALQYAVVIKQDFDTVSKLTQDIIELEDIEQNQLSEFNRAETAIGNLLDDKMEAIILLNIQALQGSANDMVTIALVSIVIAIMLAITLGIIISSYIAKPIKRLRQAVNEVEAGNLDAQFIGINNGDTEGGRRRRRVGGDGNRASRNNKNRISSFASEELIDLSHSFNSMTEKLKANNMMQKEFLGIASHELRSPIQPILSYADLATKGDLPYQQAMEKILTNALKLQSLANDILDVARIEAGQLNCVMRPVSVNRVVKDAADSIRDNLRKDVNLEIQLLEQDVEIGLDHDRIAQVLTNILGNAAKFTKKGKIKIETSRASDNSLIEIRISDTGGGIPEEILPRLFEKFATKDVGASAKQGTGLGLYISKAIVKAHNGKISAFNNPEGGSTFVISLPIEKER
jgi:signal transduction histidine kinase